MIREIGMLCHTPFQVTFFKISGIRHINLLHLPVTAVMLCTLLCYNLVLFGCSMNQLGFHFDRLMDVHIHTYLSTCIFRTQNIEYVQYTDNIVLSSMRNMHMQIFNMQCYVILSTLFLQGMHVHFSW